MAPPFSSSPYHQCGLSVAFMSISPLHRTFRICSPALPTSFPCQTINQLTHSLLKFGTQATLIVKIQGPGKLPTRLLLNIYAQMPGCRMPSTPITDNNWHRRVSRSAPRPIEITLGPPSTISATTGTP